jgi:hypothetical protein
VDLLPDLRNAVDQGIRVYPGDEETHPLDAGYDIMAKSISAFLSKSKKVIDKSILTPPLSS